MRTGLLLIAAAVIVASACCLSQPAQTRYSEVCFGASCVKAEVADDPSTRASGLMYRESLPSGEGMLFAFAGEDVHLFWMKNTLIPLDMIWLDSGLNVVYVAEATPCKTDPCRTYGPETPSVYVLEVNSGYARDNGVAVGSKASIRPLR